MSPKSKRVLARRRSMSKPATLKISVLGSVRTSRNGATLPRRLASSRNDGKPRQLPFQHSPCERIGTELKLHNLGLRPLAAFVMKRRAVAVGRPQSAAFPAAAGIVDAAIKPLGEEAHRIGHDQLDELAVYEHVQ